METRKDFPILCKTISEAYVQSTVPHFLFFLRRMKIDIRTDTIDEEKVRKQVAASVIFVCICGFCLVSSLLTLLLLLLLPAFVRSLGFAKFPAEIFEVVDLL